VLVVAAFVPAAYSAYRGIRLPARAICTAQEHAA
jgi:hypothetical protein